MASHHVLQTSPVAAAADVPSSAVSLPDLRAELERLQAECLRLRARNARLHRRLRQLSALLSEREERRRSILQAQKMEAIGELTGGIAHDFNNLLTVVSGGLHLLPAAAGDPARQGRLIRRMEGAIDRGAEVTRRLLAFARRQLLRPERIDLLARTGALELLLAQRLGERVRLTMRLRDGLWPMRADPAALELSLLNIAENARDAMPAGGRFTICATNLRLSPEKADEAGIPPGEYVEIACIDTGCGMGPEVVARAFDPFFTTKPVGQGTGLGLPQVHGFASQSGGTARVESCVGMGTCVVLLLPRAPACPPGAPAA